MTKAGLNEIGLMPQTSGSLTEFGAQVRQVKAADIGEFDMLKIAPDYHFWRQWRRH